MGTQAWLTPGTTPCTPQRVLPYPQHCGAGPAYAFLSSFCHLAEPLPGVLGGRRAVKVAPPQPSGSLVREGSPAPQFGRDTRGFECWILVPGLWTLHGQDDTPRM